MNIEKIIFLQSKQVSNFYHLLVDFLPIVYDRYKINNNLEISFDVPDCTLSLCRSVSQYIFGANVSIHSSQDIDGKDVIEYNKIKESINQEFVAYLRKIRSIEAGSSVKKKILIKRNNRYINQNIVSFLKKNGFEEICFEDYNIVEQANFVYNADFVIASHGAALTNIIFAGKQTKIVELNNGFNSGLYKRLSKFCDGSYIQFIENSYDKNNHNESRNYTFFK
jgi:capsular polysaccharide biosynthesis protein